MEAWINQWGELTIDPTKQGLSIAENLISTLGHEAVHLRQPWATDGSKMWFKNEIEANQWELDNLKFTGMTDQSRIDYIKSCISQYQQGVKC